MTNKKKIVILCVIGVLIIITLTLGITYAFMKPKVENENENTNIEINSCAKIQLKDTNSKAIDLKNTYPMDDEKGLETEAYEFTISSTCDDYVGFNLYLTSLTTNEIEDEALKFAITSTSDDVLATNALTNTTVATGDFNNEELNRLDLGINGTHKNIYKVFTNNIPLKGESTYKLYLWIDKDFEDNTTMNKKMTVGVSVKSFNRVGTMAELCTGQKASECIAKNYKIDGSIVYHNAQAAGQDGIENVDKVAGDDSYRYVGTNPNNYVCLGYECSDNPDEPGYKNLYRIMGLFDDDKNSQYETKIIKADVATKDDLGDELAIENSAYYGNYSYDKANYRGKLTTFSSYSWNSTDKDHKTTDDNNNVNMWSASNLNTKNLNETYYNAIEEPYKSMVVRHEWQVGPTYSSGDVKAVYDAELGKNKLISSSNNCYTQGDTIKVRECSEPNDLTYTDYVGLMYLSDYMYGTLPKYWTTATNYNKEEVKTNDWLYLGVNEWTISRNSLLSSNALDVSLTGYASSYNYVYGPCSVRPVVYLSSDVKITGGSGTETDPYKLEI